MKSIILAAGQGTRMKSTKPKVLHEIFKKTMINYVIDIARSANTEDIILVVGHGHEQVEANIDVNIKCILQKEQLGTGHAVKIANNHINDDDGHILVLYGDTPLIKPETIKSLYETHISQDNSVTIIASYLDNPMGYGRIVQNEKYIKIIEEKDATKEEKEIKLINVGVYIFKSTHLKLALSLLQNNNSQKEYYLTDTIDILINKNLKAGVMISDDYSEFLGVNDKMQLFEATEVIKKRVNNKHMQNGVTIVDPYNTYISPDVTIGADTIIYPNTILTGNTAIAGLCTIGANCNLHNVKVSNNVNIQNTVATDCTIGQYSNIGPFAYIRPNSIIGEYCKVGDFVEIKNSTIGNNTKVSHLTYIGDTEAGSSINFGCGTVTVNYDGANKHKTIIEDNVFIGCNANLVAPVTIEKDAFIAAGSTITKNVPSKNLAIARMGQINKSGWKPPRKK